MRSIVVVCQLALGDSEIVKTVILKSLDKEKYRVRVLCNSYNSFVFNEFEKTIYDLPIRKEFFFKVQPWLNVIKGIFLEADFILVPSGYFMEKLIVTLAKRRDRGCMIESRLITAKLQLGPRSKRMNRPFPRLFSTIPFKNEVIIESQDAYGAHFEYINLVNQSYFNSLNVNNPKRIIKEYVDTKSVKRVILQVDCQQKVKSLDNTTLLSMLNAFGAILDGDKVILSDFKCTQYSLEVHEAIRKGNWKILKPAQAGDLLIDTQTFLILVDSFFLHKYSTLTNECFVFVREANSYQWLTNNAKIFTSFHSLCYQLTV